MVIIIVVIDNCYNCLPLQGRDKREASIRELAQYLKKTYIPLRRKWLVLFPEGGFLRKRRLASQL